MAQPEILFGAALLGIFVFYSGYAMWTSLIGTATSTAEPSEQEPPVAPPMQIKDITLDDVAAGQRWRVFGDEWPEDLEGLEDLGIEPAAEFHEDDGVVYSGISVSSSGTVSALLMIKRVGDYDYGGDYCEHVGGSWRQVGLHPDPSADLGTEFIAQPLANDPSFDADGEDYRQYHRERFVDNVASLTR